jgi:hypothetical protein
MTINEAIITGKNQYKNYIHLLSIDDLYKLSAIHNFADLNTIKKYGITRKEIIDFLIN